MLANLLRRRLADMPRDDADPGPDLSPRPVGVCGSCGGDVIAAAGADVACPCGETTIPLAFFQAAAR